MIVVGSGETAPHEANDSEDSITISYSLLIL